jgi:phosphoribosylaminoimidazole (AIR) synthetase
MGVGFEVILEKEEVGSAIDIIDSFGVEAKVIGEIESGPPRKQLIIDSKFGKFTYEGLYG